MSDMTKRILSFLLAMVLLLGCSGVMVAAAYETIFSLTVIGIDGFGGGDVEAGTNLSAVLPAAPEKAGYRFTGWVVTNAAGEVIEQPEVMPSYDVTFTAQWEQLNIFYAITFLSDDGSVISTAEYREGETIEFPDYPPAGWRLMGWRNAQTGRMETVPTVMPAKDLEYLAVIEEAYYTVTFMDGTAEVGEVTVGYGEPAELIGRPPLEGKVFLGWCLTPYATAADYREGDLLDLEEDITLYALWTDEEAPAVSLAYPALVFEDEVLMNVYFSVSGMDRVVEMGLITYEAEVSQWDIDNAQDVISGYTFSEAKGLYCVTTPGIPAKELGDTLWFAVYARLADGSYMYSKLVSYSPKTYAYNMLEKGEEATKKLVVAMLNYGAAAQVYFNYHTDSLVNSSLTDTQLASIDSYRADMMTPVIGPDGAKGANFANNGGYTRRYPGIVFEGAFAISYYFIPSYTPVGDITMYYWNQADFDAADVLTRENATEAIVMLPGDSYSAVIDGIAAKDLDKGVYVSFCYSDGTTEYCSGILAYSIGTYCVGKVDAGTAMAPFAKATAVYGYYAKERFY